MFILIDFEEAIAMQFPVQNKVCHGYSVTLTMRSRTKQSTNRQQMAPQFCGKPPEVRPRMIVGAQSLFEPSIAIICSIIHIFLPVARFPPVGETSSLVLIAYFVLAWQFCLHQFVTPFLGCLSSCCRFVFRLRFLSVVLFSFLCPSSFRFNAKKKEIVMSHRMFAARAYRYHGVCHSSWFMHVCLVEIVISHRTFSANAWRS